MSIPDHAYVWHSVSIVSRRSACQKDYGPLTMPTFQRLCQSVVSHTSSREKWSVRIISLISLGNSRSGKHASMLCCPTAPSSSYREHNPVKNLPQWLQPQPVAQFRVSEQGIAGLEQMM